MGPSRLQATPARASPPLSLVIVAAAVAVVLAVAQLVGARYAARFQFQEQDALIDAYDPLKCGLVSLDGWTLGQSAYGCSRATPLQLPQRGTHMTRIVRPFNNMLKYARPRRRSQRGSRSDGSAAQNGQFPFYVRLKSDLAGDRAQSIECGGTLIHDDLVLTSAACVAGAQRIGVLLGSYLRAPGTEGNLTLGSRYCLARGFRLASPQMYDLAVVKLRDKQRYRPGKVAPACLRSRSRHSADSVCSLTGMGRLREPAGSLERDLDFLLTLPVRRQCEQLSLAPHLSCYLSQKTNTGCPYDPGSPVVCYDKCQTSESRAFVVGVTSKYFLDTCPKPDMAKPFFATDLNHQHQALLELIYTAKNDKEPPLGGPVCANVS